MLRDLPPDAVKLGVLASDDVERSAHRASTRSPFAASWSGPVSVRSGLEDPGQSRKKPSVCQEIQSAFFSRSTAPGWHRR